MTIKIGVQGGNEKDIDIMSRVANLNKVQLAHDTLYFTDRCIGLMTYRYDLGRQVDVVIRVPTKGLVTLEDYLNFLMLKVTCEVLQ